MQKTCVKEYVEVMTPVARDLDVLQGEMVAGPGCLLPTLCVIKSQLLELLIDQHAAPLSLTICQSLERALIDGINSRFGTVFDAATVQLASLQYIPSLNLTGWKIKSRLQNIFSPSLDKSSLLFASLCSVNILR